MRLKGQSVGKRRERDGAYTRLSLRLISCAILGAGCAFTSFAKNIRGELSVDSIDARITVLQQRVDSLTAVMNTLRDDSAKTVAAPMSDVAPDAKQLAEIDTELAKSKSDAVDLKTSYDKARQDSIALAAKFHDQLSALRKTGDSLDKALRTVRAAAATNAGRPVPRDSVADARAIARLQGETARDDSLLHDRESVLSAITAEVDKLRQDSIAAEKRRNDDRDRFNSQLHALDSQIAASDAEVNKAGAQHTAAKAENERKIAQIQNVIKQTGIQKQQYADRIAVVNKEVGVLGADRARLTKSAGDEQNRYAALRAPYDSAIARAEAHLESLSQDKPLFEALKTKLNLDHDISIARELLDKAIQTQTKKKSSQRLVDAREAKLDTLLSQRDSIVGATAGIKEREAAFNASVTEGGDILPLVDSALEAINASLAGAESARDVARKNLAQFEQTNPATKNPAPSRAALFNSMITAKKNEAIKLTDVNDSLNIQIEASQKTLAELTAAAQAEEASADNLMRTKNDAKATVAKNRTKLLHDKVTADLTDAAPILVIKTRYNALARQKFETQSDIDRISAALAKSKQDLSALQERIKQATASIAAAKMRADSLSAVQQKQQAELTDEQAKNAQAIASLQAQQDQQIRAVADPIAQYVSAIAENNKTIASLLANKGSIKNASLSGKQSAQDRVRKIVMELRATNKLVDNEQRRIAALKTQREYAAAQEGKKTAEAEQKAAAALQKTKDHDQAMKEFNDIFSLLSNQKNDEAKKLFKQNQQFLKRNLDSDNFKAIKATIDRM
jgi:hypothetical protein